MARGGAREGKPGGNYINRSDMRSTQPIQAPSGGGYGDRKALEDAQRAMPLENTAGVQGDAMAASQEQAAPSVLPGGLGALNRPTERPGEPVTAGAALGPGPNQLSAPPVDDLELNDIARYLPTLELIASLPNTSSSTRNFIRRIRGSAPVQPEQ